MFGESHSYAALCSRTCASHIQFCLPKPKLGSVNGARVELNPEHYLSLCRVTPPMVALHLQTWVQQSWTQQNFHITSLKNVYALK